MNPIEKLLTVREVANLFGLDEQTIYRLLRRGELPHQRIGRTIRFIEADLQEYLNDVTQGGGRSD